MAPRKRAEPEQPDPRGRDLVASVEADLDGLVTAHPLADSLRALARTLALDIVGSESTRDRATMAKELRATLTELGRIGGSADADALARDLSSPD